MRLVPPARFTDASLSLELACVLVFSSIVLGSIVLGPAAAGAERYPTPRTDYSADVKMQLGQEERGEAFTSRGKEYYSDGKRRREMSAMGQETVHIERPDKGVSWTLIPSMRMYMEHRDGDHGQQGDVPDPLGRETDVELEKLGTEKINGVRANKFRVKMDDGAGTAWLTAENVPVRFEGRVRSDDGDDGVVDIRVDYENIRTGPQKAALFELPEGYSSGSPFGLPGLPAGAIPDGGESAPNEAELEQYKRQMQDVMERLRREMGSGAGGR